MKQGKERTERPPAKQKSKVNTLLEIAKHRAKDIPSDFFQVVSSSDIEHSPFSAHQTSTIMNKNNLVANKRNKIRKRNYKRRNLLLDPYADR